MPYISHYNGEVISDSQAFQERAAFRTLTWKGTSWVEPDFGSDVVPFLITTNLQRDDLLQARNLIQAELAKDDTLYRVEQIRLEANLSNGTIQVFLDEVPLPVI